MHCGCGLREYEQMRRLDLFTFAEDRRLGRHEQQLFEKMRGATVLAAAGKRRNVPTDRQQMLGRRGGQERRQDRLGAVERRRQMHAVVKPAGRRRQRAGPRGSEITLRLMVPKRFRDAAPQAVAELKAGYVFPTPALRPRSVGPLYRTQSFPVPPAHGNLL
jgi:hypothetical protein